MRIEYGITTAIASLLAAAAAAQPADTQTISGQLEAGDRIESAEGPVVADEHRLRLEAGRRYRISASSEAFDTVIDLFQQGEPEPVAHNDDFNPSENLNARITYTPEESDEYVLRVRGYMGEGSGPYEVRVEPLPPLPAPISAEAGDAAETDWQIWLGELASTDADRDGAHFDDYLVAMRAGETRLISVESGAFDPIVWVLRADSREGEPLDLDDDTGPGVNALLGFQPDEDGNYIVRVTSYGGGDSGAYRLRISEALIPPPPAPPAEPSEGSAD